MKILHILDHSIPLHSGYTFRTRAILEQQRALGWQTAHVTSAKHGVPGPAVEEVDGLRFYRTRMGEGPAARLPVLNQWEVVRSLERRLPEVIAVERPDLLHAHSPSLNGLAALRVGRRLGLPVVYECRAFWEDAAADHGTSREWGPRYRLTRALETRVFRRADAVTCICEGLRGDILARGIPPEKVTVIPNAVDVERFAYDQPRDAALAGDLGLGGATVLGFLGSFYAYEGLTLAVRALPEILTRHSQARLLLVGGGPQEAELRALAQGQGVAGQVVFTGRVPHDRVDRYYSLVDVLLYPRLPMRLTELVTPLKPLEAMAQGKLVLASDVGGHRELIRHGGNGRLFAAGSAQALADAVCDLLADRGVWETQRRAGRRYVEEERNWPASVARYRGVYARLTGQSADTLVPAQGDDPA
jgi:PEP-CTERM/exosortase A-associated glycosyltransferase